MAAQDSNHNPLNSTNPLDGTQAATITNSAGTNSAGTNSAGTNPAESSKAESSPAATGVNNSDLLQKLLNHLVVRVRKEQLETWFRSLLVVRTDDAEIELSVTSQFVRDWLAKNYLREMQEAVDSLGTPHGRRRLVLTHRAEDGQDSLRLVQTSPADEIERVMRNTADARMRSIDGAPVPPVTRTSVNQSSVNQAPDNNLHHVAAASKTEPGKTVPAEPIQPPKEGYRQRPGNRISHPLNPNYTFDRFVVGPCNRLAHASALAIGENPGHAYNPLFVHGNVGLGKTHLLQAICHTVLRRDPNARVLYMSCENFTNSYIQAIQAHQIDSFREYHRGADVLVIDDIQFLANKEKTQDEFFHTFNALFDGQRQIVLSSDRPPVEIPTIEERLVSRFKWGLVAEVETPCIDTRKAIVSNKAAGRGVDLPEEVAQFLAERVTSNIRELEGAVIKVVGFAAITDQPITLSLAERCLRGMPMRRAQVTSEEVMTLITGEFAIMARELIGKSRTQAVSMPRQIAMFLLREHTESSLEDIGKIFGNRDHTTVIYAVNKVRERATKDRMFKELLDGLSSRLMTRSFRT